MASSLFVSGTGIVAAGGVGLSYMGFMVILWLGVLTLFSLVLIIAPVALVVLVVRMLGGSTKSPPRRVKAFGVFLVALIAFVLISSEFGGDVTARVESNTLKTHYSISDARFSYVDAASDDGGTFWERMENGEDAVSTVNFVDRDGGRHSGTVRVQSGRVVLYDDHAFGPGSSIVEYGTGPSKAVKPEMKSKKTNTPSKARKGTFRGTEPKTYDYTDEPVKGAQGAV